MELLETMRVDETGAIPLLERHLARVAGSARHFGYVCDTDRLRTAILEEARRTRSVVFRLLLARDGTFQLQHRPIPERNFSRLVRAPSLVNSDDPMLYHKTTARTIYEEARAGCDADTDVILVNERGEATETSIANVAVLRNGIWITPHVSAGLLAGTLRAQLLEEGRIVEGVVPAGELVPGEIVRCFNAVRGIYDVPFAAILAS